MRKLQKISGAWSHSRHNSKSSGFSGRRDSVEIEADLPPTSQSSVPKDPNSTGLRNNHKGSGASNQASSHGTPEKNPSLAASSSVKPNSTPTRNSSGLRRMPSTIRPVASFDASDSSTCDSPSAHNSAFSSSTNSATSNTSYTSHPNGDSTPTVRLKYPPVAASSEKPLPSLSNGMSRRAPPERPGSTRDHLSGPPQQIHANDHQGQEHWDSSVGKAGLGKTGRVINKLVSDNEALKRDIQIERLKAEEARQAAKLLEDKMERMAADYEARLLEAQVTKTLLARKERQVESLCDQVGLEKKKTLEALDRERNWREEMEKSQSDATRRVEEAETKSLMLEGRYNAISSHWKDQGNEMKRATSKLRKEMATLVEERKKDDEKISILHDLCDQQDCNIRELTKQKQSLSQQFEAYKTEQEHVLKDIKTHARETEEEQVRILEETRETLHRLKWVTKMHKVNLGA